VGTSGTATASASAHGVHTQTLFGAPKPLFTSHIPQAASSPGVAKRQLYSSGKQCRVRRFVDHLALFSFAIWRWKNIHQSHQSIFWKELTKAIFVHLSDACITIAEASAVVVNPTQHFPFPFSTTACQIGLRPIMKCSTTHSTEQRRRSTERGSPSWLAPSYRFPFRLCILPSSVESELRVPTLRH
jgi:hypothetical protein